MKRQRYGTYFRPFAVVSDRGVLATSSLVFEMLDDRTKPPAGNEHVTTGFFVRGNDKSIDTDLPTNWMFI